MRVVAAARLDGTRWNTDRNGLGQLLMKTLIVF